MFGINSKPANTSVDFVLIIYLTVVAEAEAEFNIWEG